MSSPPQPGAPAPYANPPGLSSAILLSVLIVVAFFIFLVLVKVYSYYRPTSAISLVVSGGRRPAQQRPAVVKVAKRSLSLRTIESFPTYEHEAEDLEAGDGEDTVSGRKECAVCLVEYEPHDLLKKLPACGHSFHSSCITAWLLNSTTCPICRENLKVEAPPSSTAQRGEALEAVKEEGDDGTAESSDEFETPANALERGEGSGSNEAGVVAASQSHGASLEAIAESAAAREAALARMPAVNVEAQGGAEDGPRSFASMLRLEHR